MFTAPGATVRTNVLSLFLLILSSAAAPLYAGGGPENVAVVVNAGSWASKTIANEYVRLRGIPPCNVVYVENPSGFESIRLEEFREKILKPVLQTLERRRLAGQIDYIAYSCDLPWRIEVQADKKRIKFRKGSKTAKVLTPFASTNGLTYLYGFLFADSPNYLGLNTNRYWRRPLQVDAARRLAAEKDPAKLRALAGEVFFDTAPSRGFRNSYKWNAAGETADQGVRYMLSTMLAVTSGRGNSLREALACLRRSAAADGTLPRGTIYYMFNSNIRSRVRHWAFWSAAAALNRLGVKAEVLHGSWPNDRKDIRGAMVGAVAVDWSKSKAEILPGAVCEHLTSTGGMLTENAGQMALSEFIARGAAGSSGAVYEPFAVLQKFPDAFLHVHYASGCSLAEAFYQSIRAPYQLLIVGDPLCRPWARIPVLSVSGIEPNASVSGAAHLHVRVRDVGGAKVRQIELFMDGRMVKRLPCAERIRFDTAQLPDGFHELRLVAVADDAVETRGDFVLPFNVNNRGRVLSAVRVGAAQIRWGRPVRLKVAMKGASKISVCHNERVVGEIASDAGEVTIDSRALGIGPVRLQARATVAAGRDGVEIRGRPVECRVLPPAALPGLTGLSKKKFAPGMKLTCDGRVPVIVEDMKDSSWAERAFVPLDRPFTLEGYFDAPEDDLYQFQLKASARLSVFVDSVEVEFGEGSGWRFAPVSLGAGTHLLRIRAVLAGRARFQLRFGAAGTRRIDPARFRHVVVPSARRQKKAPPKPKKAATKPKRSAAKPRRDGS